MTDSQADKLLPGLAETKFYPPLLHKDYIQRSHLLETLHSSLSSYPLTLISAPAGYGKTTLLTALPEIYPDLPLAWLSLDEEDNDPARFFTALILAMQHLNPSSGETAYALLTNPIERGADVRRVTSVLINDVLESFSKPFVLILDDLHRISTPSIFTGLDYLLENRPQQLHLVVSTRVDPPLALARLRARGELVELRFSDLRFSDDEANAFLNDQLRLDLPSSDVAELQTLAEGWPAGLRLLATSLDRVDPFHQRQTFIHHLAHTDRNIFDFLAEEVFNRQSAEIKAFLLETSILPEMTPELCQAVTKRSDAGAILNHLFHSNLFLIQVSPFPDQEGAEPRVPQFDQPRLQAADSRHQTYYRYHDLFAEFLRSKLQQTWPARIPELHRRAAAAESDPARAVAHYLDASHWQEAAELIEQTGAKMFSRGYLETLNRWINRLPTSVRDSHPRLLHYMSHSAFMKESWVEVQSLLERALHGFEQTGDEVGQGEVLVDLATCAVGQGDMKRSVMLHSQALNYDIPPHTRVQALLGRALVHGAWGDSMQAERDFKAAMKLVRQSGNLDPLFLVTLPFFHPDFAFIPGGLKHLEYIANQAKDLVKNDVGPVRLMVDELTTVLHLFRGRLREAIQIGEQALRLRKRLGGHPYLSLNAALFLMVAHTARGDFVRVEPLFEVLFMGVDQSNQPPPDLPIFLFYAGRIRWLQGRLTEAQEIYQRMCTLIDEGSSQDIMEVLVCREWMRSLLAMAEGRYGEAERALRQDDVLEQKDRGSIVHGNSRLMLARLYWQQNRQEELLAELDTVLAFLKQLGIPYPLLLEGPSVVPLLREATKQGLHEKYAAYLLELLGAKDGPRPVDVPHTGATLTPREAEVLSCVVAGYSNQDIAEQLVISEWTVKSHLTRIYRKLEVSSRTQAIARARGLGFS